MNTNLGGKSFILLAAFGAAITLGATVTHAGFEWVPPTQPAAAPEVTPAAPNVTVAPGIPPATASDAVLPLPGEESTPTPVAAAPLAPPPPVAPAPVAAAPAPVMPIPTTPQLKASDAAAANDVPVNTLLDAPSGYQAQPLLPPEENTAMKVREVTPPPAAPENAPLSITDSRPVLPEPVTSQQMAPPPAFERPAYEPMDMSPPPVVAAQQPRVFMPEDAPQTALDNTPNSQKLVINPRPYGDASPAAMSAPAPSFDSVVASATQTPSDKPVLEGFGSDMPLALALQQIVPADYVTSFESGVNVGQTVSWDGGKPWDQVVNDMLAPLQLQAVIVNKTVHVRSPGGWRQGDASPAQDKNNLRRANIKDPGEQSEQQDTKALADIATASGGPEKITPAEDRAASKAEPATPAETETLPTPEQLNAETPDEAPAAQQDVQNQNTAEKPALPLLAAAPEADKTSANPWEAKAGESLRDILTRWSEQAGVELVWMASYDYKIKQDVALKDDFTNAVESVIATGLDAEASATPELQIMQKPGAQAPGGILIRDKRA
jgi:hypothetical protein